MPGGMYCSVATCKSNSNKAKATGEKLMFFRFPTELKMRKEWMRKCSRKDKWSANNKRICKKHFKADDFQDEMQARLLNLQPKKLKKDAIPSLYLLPNEEKINVTTRTKRALSKKRKAIVESLLLDNFKHTPSAVAEEIMHDVDISQIPSTSKETDFDILQRKFESLQHEFGALQQEFGVLQQENSLLKEKVSDHVNIENELRQQIKKDADRFDEKVKLALKDCLTSNQVKIALKKENQSPLDLGGIIYGIYYFKNCDLN